MAKRTYESDGIRVWWNSERCIHSAVCLNSLPEVFDLNRRPWVDPDAASADAIAATIGRCPSGALAFERLDGGPQEEVPAHTLIRSEPNGPNLVHGDVRVYDSGGNPLPAGLRFALCRCGGSRNQPFCDTSHRRTGFHDDPAVVASHREEAESPGGVTWPNTREEQ